MRLLCVFIICLLANISTAQVTNVNIGTSPNDRTGDTLRQAYIKLNANDNYLYTLATNSSQVNTNNLIVSLLTITGTSNVFFYVTNYITVSRSYNTNYIISYGAEDTNCNKTSYWNSVLGYYTNLIGAIFYDTNNLWWDMSNRISGDLVYYHPNSVDVIGEWEQYNGQAPAPVVTWGLTNTTYYTNYVLVVTPLNMQVDQFYGDIKGTRGLIIESNNILLGTSTPDTSIINGSDDNGVQYGTLADGGQMGAAVGYSAYGANHGVAIGALSRGDNDGVGIGLAAIGDDDGVAIGELAAGEHSGVGIGFHANGTYGVAVGGGTSVGNNTTGNIAVGFGATIPDNWNDTTEIGGGTAALEGGLSWKGRPIVNTLGEWVGGGITTNINVTGIGILRITNGIIMKITP